MGGGGKAKTMPSRIEANCGCTRCIIPQTVSSKPERSFQWSRAAIEKPVFTEATPFSKEKPPIVRTSATPGVSMRIRFTRSARPEPWR
jgi:hypothetical protein